MNRTRRRGQAAIAVAAALLGFLLATQLQVEEGLRDRLAIEREADLSRILADLSGRSDRLSGEIVELRVQLREAEASAEREDVLLRAAQEELATLKILRGVTAVRGQGIVATISDPTGAVGPDVVLDVIQELRDAGAEAIEVGDVRVGAATFLGGTTGDVQIDGRPVRWPLVVRAIGARQTLAEALRIPGGVADVLASRGAGLAIEQRNEINIRTLHEVRPFTYARSSEAAP